MKLASIVLIIATMKALLIAALMAALVSPAQAALMTLNYQGDKLNFRISGEIKPGDDVQFKELTKDYMINDIDVVLESPGGAFIPALNIGEMIKARHWQTRVSANSLCASSCAYIWLAGSTRKATATSMIGFHRIYLVNQDRTLFQEDPIDNAYLGRYLGSLGFDYAFIEFVTKSGPQEMTFLTAEDANKYKINFEGGLPSSQPNLSQIKRQPSDDWLQDGTTKEWTKRLIDPNSLTNSDFKNGRPNSPVKPPQKSNDEHDRRLLDEFTGRFVTGGNGGMDVGPFQIYAGHVFAIYLLPNHLRRAYDSLSPYLDIWRADLLADDYCNYVLTSDNWRLRSADWRIRIMLPDGSFGRECRAGERFAIRYEEYWNDQADKGDQARRARERQH